MSDINIQEGKGHGFLNKDGKKCMEKCFSCGKENYAMTVMSGFCAWCLFNANAKKEDDGEK